MSHEPLNTQTPSPKVTPCGRCRRLIAWTEHNRRIGLPRHYGHGLCYSCSHVRSAGGGRLKSRDPYIDPIAVERAIAGDRVTLTVAERRAAAELLTDRGYSAADIARRLGVSQRVVTRYRARARLEVAA